MNSIEALEVLKKAGEVNSQNLKADILRLHISDPLLRKIFAAALDSFVTYGVTIASSVSGQGSANFDHLDTPIWNTLDRLASRHLTGAEMWRQIDSLRMLYNEPSFELFKRIVNKDLRVAVTSTIVNRLLPGFIPVFDVMLAQKYEAKRIKSFPVAVEPKRDGVRVVCIANAIEAKFYSRSGKLFPAIDHIGPHVVAALKNLERWAYGPLARLDEDRDHFRSKLRSYLGGQHREPKLVLEGEVVSGTFAKTVGDVRRKDATATDAVYEIFDAISMESFLADDSTEPYSFRRLVIESFDRAIISGSLTILERRLAGSHEEIQAIYESYRDAGHEGGMVKPLDGLYQKKRSHAWLKMKNEDSEDLMVIGAFEGEGKYAGMLGGLIVDRNGVAVKVGAGFSDQQRKTFWTNDEDVRGRLIEVEYHEVLESGSLRHPRFVAFRDTAEAPGIKI